MSPGRTFVVGDIHGCVDELDGLLDGIAPGVDDKVVFLGDYIDRGPSPKGVIDRLLRLQREGPQCVFLKGNHEDMFLGFLGRGGRYGEMFLRNGGAATLRSYGVEWCGGPEVAAAMPPDHLSFLDHLELTHAHESFFCVHAGLNPDNPIDQQNPEDLLWIRDEWLPCRHDFPFTVLFGHTPLRAPMVDLPYKIGLDTGLVYSNLLSCFELSSRRVFQIRRGERTTRAMSLDEATHGDPGLALNRTRPGA